MRIKLEKWNDGFDNKRLQIINDVVFIMKSFFKNDALYTSDLTIQSITKRNCFCEDLLPCTHDDRSIICISSDGAYWCQFIHQLSHELCHCSTSRISLPKKIRWFDEFVCCCSSFFVEKYISSINDGRYDYMFGEKTNDVFYDYFNGEQIGHVYKVKDTKDFFALHRKQYEQDENLIKKHDVYVRRLFELIGDNLTGFSFVGKMWKVGINECETIESYLAKLLNICNEEEKLTIDIVLNIFGINLDD